MVVGLLDVGRDLALALRVHVVVGARNLVAALRDDLLRLGERDARERRRRHGDLDAERGLDLGAVLVFDGLEAGDQQVLVQRHDILVAVDPAELGVDARELGRVAAA